MNEYLLIGYKTILFLVIILILIRIMGKRELGELNVFDIIISFMISELFSNAIANQNTSILMAVFPILIIFLVQISISLIVLKFPKIRSLIESEPVIIIEKGKIKYKEMKRQRYNTSDLLLQIREKGIEDLKEIEYAILEINGSLSIFTKDKIKYRHPFPLISDGKIERKMKDILNISDEYIFTQLKKNNIDDINAVFLAFVNLDNSIIFFLKEDNSFNKEKYN